MKPSMKSCAVEYYISRKGNCAQSVAAAWHKKTARNGELVEKLHGCGHGNAPNGLCGALYALRCIVGTEHADQVSVEFHKAAGGYTSCADIRSSGALACMECIVLAAEILDNHLSGEAGLLHSA